jgi:hypothetical protein
MRQLNQSHLTTDDGEYTDRTESRFAWREMNDKAAKASKERSQEILKKIRAAKHP